ncbi:ABC transporter ATP-binding protein [Gordonia hongkongensis]
MAAATTALTADPVAAMRLDLEDIRIGYGDSTVIDGFDLVVGGGEIVVLTGPSGCGKSTILRAVAGLLPVRGGRILADGDPVVTTSRDRAMVFQDDALHPWRTVRGNILLALTLRGVPRRHRRDQAEQWITEIGLDGFADHLPKSLSGGMRQRVQLARGLAGSPRAVLMDEPFGALDAQTRTAMQRLLLQTLSAHPSTVVFVTHDVDEALLLGDRVVVLGRAGETVRATVDVPHPRDPDRRGDDATRRLRRTILDALEK